MTTRRFGRGRAMAAAVLVLVAASMLLGGSVHAQTAAEEGPGLGGYDGTAHASGLHVFYNPEGVLPVAAPVNFGAPDALATITSGPSTHGRAAVFDPGDLLVNPDALLAQADPSYPEGTLPRYPFRISATSSFGEPAAESRPAPGLSARVEAKPNGSTARASTPEFDVPAIVTVGSMSSAASTDFEGSTVSVHARTEISSFDLLGLLTIDSIVTDVVATSSGDGTEVSGGTTITGASLLGRPVTIDAEGVHVEPDGDSIPLLGPLRDALLDDLLGALTDAGIRITLPGPIEQTGETTGQLGTTGLRVDIEISDRTVPLLGQIIDALPPLENPIPGAPGIEDVLALAQARNLVALDVGRATVSLTASPAFVPPPFEAPDTDVASGPARTPTPSGPVSVPSLAPVANTAAPTPSTTPIAASPTPALSTETPTASVAAGIGALAVLALLVQPFIGDRIARASAAILATSPVDACPLEKP